MALRDYASHHHHHRIEPRDPKSHSHLFTGLSNIITRCRTNKFESSSFEKVALLPSSTPSSLSDKYGSCTDILHYGSQSSVRVYAKSFPSASCRNQAVHVIKVFRRSSNPAVLNRQLFEQSLASTVSHPNILRALDVLHNNQREPCLVTEYCAGGDLKTLISTYGTLDALEADCFFKQIMRAVSYLHDNAVAHRDIKTENILLTAHGAVKLTDFGSAQWLSEETGKDIEQTGFPLETTASSPPRKLAGTLPYLPPEELSEPVSDPRPGDIWAAGLVYMAMRCGYLLWRMPCTVEDTGFKAYLRGRQSCHGYRPIEDLNKTSCQNVIYAMLCPIHSRRIVASDVLRSEWVYGIHVCDPGDMGW
ncbi:kinase-like domain-containing protein [Aspergillus ambiguus]|uniref:kinase-like domain-containing protein n=1 Tax=Aspergillus ambiguus TaxID=176160 RepID=UPI003CCD2DCC